MADVTRKRGATSPALIVQLTQTVNGVASPINLTTAQSVTFFMRTLSGGPVVSGACSITTAATGIVTYPWTTPDVATTGVYAGEFVITWNDGTIDKVPSGNPEEGSDRGDFLTIEIVEDIEGVAPVVTGGVGG